MTQKQIFGVVIGVVIVAVASFFVYQQFTQRNLSLEGNQSMVLPAASPEKKMAPILGAQDVVVPVPDTIDSIAESIEGETALDLSALDEEEAGSLSEVGADSDSVNNLGTSYDENNL